ncbi:MULTISPECIES: ABC transporter substrate-binding protein [unclassified Cytobacillus]|uniref:ABC transporter substrate-binding protein n=1 Tax=unclassified Cytobacillus TaxID=2675268 RepID=UPI00135813C9|nr:ABC transporter substrate-binding protein [Cytobacillus sp. AMY 15.2]KAF0820491.1 Dipeptide ABC transporter, substrate-binding protein DppA [Bacillus sp. ZZV12-4809]MCM3090385.1 ABC transporter substrate-binding protein [Cytobacillus sp. AMY 15.2]
MKKRKGIWFLVAALLLSLALAGCSSNSSSGTKDEKDKEKGTDTEETSSGGTLVFGRGGDSTSLDPAITTEGESFKVTKNIYETLIEFGEQDTEIQPGLATEWESSEDGLKHTLKLREGVKFHDGTDFNAEAVVFNFERWKAGSAEQFYYYNSQFGDKISEVKAVDDYTVEFTLNKPIAPFFKNLAMSPFGIASPAAIEKHGDKFIHNPVGTGPFVFKEYKANDRITLVKNEDYWDEGLPKLDQVIFRVIPENSARLNALATGEVDLIDGVNFSDVGQIEGNPDLQTFERPSLNVAYLGLTSTRGPLKDKKVRQALNYAVDKQALIDAFYAGAAEPAKNPMPSVVAGYNDDVKDYEYDPEKAKELLKEAGYEDGFEMELWAMPVPRPYMPDGQKVAEALQANFDAIGVKAKIVTYEWGTYLDKAKNGEADTFLLGWTGDNGDADNFLYVLLDQDSIGSNNYSYYQNPEVHELLVKAQASPDQEERDKLYKEAQLLIKEDAPWIPLVHSRPILAGKADITGFKPHPTGSDLLSTVEFK